MRSWRRIASLLIFLVPLVCLGWLGFIMIRRYYRSAEQDLRPVLETELTNALRHEVRVGKVTLARGRAYIDDVRIAERRTLAEHGPIVKVRQIVVDFDLRRILLTRTIPDPLFGNGTVIDPVAYVRRDATGHWNFEDLVRQRPGAKQPSPVGRLTVVNGLIE